MNLHTSLFIMVFGVILSSTAIAQDLALPPADESERSPQLKAYINQLRIAVQVSIRHAEP